MFLRQKHEVKYQQLVPICTLKMTYNHVTNNLCHSKLH